MTRMFVRGLVPVLGIVLTACNNPHRVSQGLTLGSAATGNGTLSGTLVNRQTGAPLVGATVRLGGVTTVSSASGAFTLQGVPDSGAGVVTVVLPGYVYRGAAFTLAGSRTGVTIDVLQDAAPFSLSFYRQLVRGTLDSATLQATRPWTSAPNFHFAQLTTDQSTTPIRVPDEIIQQLEANFTASVPELTGGKLQVGAFVVEDNDVAAQNGWVNVTFQQFTGASLGFTTVGGNQGAMVVMYNPAVASNGSNNPYGCASISLAIADDLIAHAMGYWETTNEITDLFSGSGCPGAGRPANTLYHAAIMYSRPAGNADPDVDPVESAQSVAPRAAPRAIIAYDPSRLVRRR